MNNPTLVYAFESWGKNNANISEQVLKRLGLPVDKQILKIRFDFQVFRNIVNQNYSQIIGLGQYPSGKTIRIEQVAQNTYGTRSKGYHPIDEGPNQITTDLKLIPTNNSTLTSDAGRFVCNYSMYSILRMKSDSQRFAFIHIPKGINVKDATNYVEELLKQVVVTTSTNVLQNFC